MGCADPNRSRSPFSYLISSGKALRYYDRGVRETAHAIKCCEWWAIAQAAVFLSRQVGKDDLLIPIPGRHGYPVQTLFLSIEISRITRATVWPGMRSKNRPSLYDLKTAGINPAGFDFGFYLLGVLPAAKKYWLVDNVIGTGSTMRAALDAVGITAEPLVYAASI